MPELWQKHRLPLLLKPLNWTLEDFENLNDWLQSARKAFYESPALCAFHQQLNQMRTPSGLERIKQSFKQQLIHQPLNWDQQSLQKIDANQGDRMRLNRLLLKYAKLSAPELHESWLTPQLKQGKGRKNLPPLLYLPAATDSLLFLRQPLCLFELIEEARSYSFSGQSSLRALYLDQFVQRWFGLLVGYLEDFRGDSDELNTLLRKKSASDSQPGAMVAFLRFLVAQRLSSKSSYQNAYVQRHLDALRMLLFNAVFQAVLRKQPPNQTLFECLGELKVETQHHGGYANSFLTTSYAQLHSLPLLVIHQSDPKELPRLEAGFSQLTALPLHAQALILLALTPDEQNCWLERLWRLEGEQAIKSMHTTIRNAMNRPEPEWLQRAFQIQGLGSDLLSRMRHFLASQTGQNLAGLTTSLQAQADSLADQSVVNSNLVSSQRQKQWQSRTVQHIPQFSKVKNFEQLQHLRLSVPESTALLQAMSPYSRVPLSRVKERLSLAQAVELGRITFGFLVPDMETGQRVVSICLLDFLLMRLVGEFEVAFRNFLQFALNNGQIASLEQVDLLHHLYAACYHRLEPLMERHLRFDHQFRFAWPGGSFHAHNVSLAVTFATDLQWRQAPYLAGGKLWWSLAERVAETVWQLINPDYLQVGATVESSAVESFLSSEQFDMLVKKSIPTGNKPLQTVADWYFSRREDREQWQRRLTDLISLIHRMRFEEVDGFLLP